MADLTQLRTAARQIFDETLRVVDAGEAVHCAVQTTGDKVSICDVLVETREIYAIAIGKAAWSMADALEQATGGALVDGVLIGPPADQIQSQWLATSRFRFHAGGHPLPNQNSLAAAVDAVALVQKAERTRGLIVFLISGGGSAMMEWTSVPNVTLADLRATNKVLVGCGASISEINSVRRAFSAVKGGKLAARAPHCDQITLIISDVPRGEEYNVASGPSIAPDPDAPNARDVIAGYHLGSQLPPNIIQAIENSREFQNHSDALRKHVVLLDNQDALQAARAAAEQRGFKDEIANDIADQAIAEGCQELSNRLQQLVAEPRNDSPVCLISGGEFACPVKGNGVGGRNLETALRIALLRRADRTDFVALCAGSDGIDGNSPAAGAVVDSTTIARANALGLDAEDFLRRSDSYSFFAGLGDALTTGVTGTNVRDLRILLATKHRAAS